MNSSKHLEFNLDTVYWGENRTDSLNIRFALPLPDTDKVNTLNHLVSDYTFSNPDTALIIAFKAVDILNNKYAVNSLDYKKYKVGTFQYRIGLIYAKTLRKIGVCYWVKSEYRLAIDNLLIALEVNEALNNKAGISICKSNLGLVFKEQSELSKSLEYFFEALSISEELQDKAGMARDIGNIGLVYFEQKDYDKSLEFYTKAIAIAREINDLNAIAINLGNMGNIYLQNEYLSETADPESRFELALRYNNEALELERRLKNKSREAIWLGNIGIIYYKKQLILTNPKEKEEAVKMSLNAHTAALQITRELGDKNGEARHLSNIGVLYSDISNFQLAEQNLLLALNLNREIGALEDQRFVEQMLSALYQKMKKFDLALIHSQKVISLTDSILNEDSRKQIMRNEINFEFQKKEVMLEANSEKERALANEQNRKKNVIIYSVIGGLTLVLVFAIFILRALRITHKQKITIEQKEKETQLQNEIIKNQKNLVEEKHKEITDSIHYAERIQRSFLATKEILSNNLNEYFIFFRPKDVVSGDFYWSAELENGKFALAVADSTGHGVPGAIMSILNITCLENSIKKKLQEPSIILDDTRQQIIERLKKDGSEEGGKDGMDCALVVFDFKSLKINFALANNPLWIIRKDELIEFSSDKMPVGKHIKENISFTNQEFHLEKDDLVILFTDGYADQFGGPNGKKLKYSVFKEKLLQNKNKELSEIKKAIKIHFDNWKGHLEQVDDVCVIGVRV